MRRVLIANRAEIATRVIRTCHKLGIETVSIYSEEDKNLPFASESTYSVCLGSGTVTETYINKSKIVEICKELDVDAIHPGYGFLSENSEFAELLEKNNITFIGPSAKNILLMGDKLESKNFVKSLGLPVVPGYEGDDQSNEKLVQEAKKIGFPVLIKASSGGGGKGMKIVREESDFLEQLSFAKSEALKFFGNDRVILEKYVLNPRHIEVQVLGDGQGNGVHLFERECSIQRRYQKVIEETPSKALDDKLRKDICNTAVNLVKGLNYKGAGTVEMILDSDKNYYFLEMNTRLQVEHGISEMITGVDLVEEQIRIARGDGLTYKQDEIRANGHSFECRVYAEDPENNFMPQSGLVENMGETIDPTVRIDTGYINGNIVGINYDPMIAKILTHDSSRESNLLKMKEALKDLPFLGVKNNRDFMIKVLEHPKFVSGDYHTHSLDSWMENLNIERKNVDIAFAAFSFVQSSKKKKSNTLEIVDPWSEGSSEWLG